MWSFFFFPVFASNSLSIVNYSRFILHALVISKPSLLILKSDLIFLIYSYLFTLICYTTVFVTWIASRGFSVYWLKDKTAGFKESWQDSLSVHQSQIIGNFLCYRHLVSENTSKNQEPCWRKKAETKNQLDTKVMNIPKLHPRIASFQLHQQPMPGMSSEMKSSRPFCTLKCWVILEMWGLWSPLSKISASLWVTNKLLYKVSLERDVSRPVNLTTNIWMTSLYPQWMAFQNWVWCVCLCVHACTHVYFLLKTIG